MSTYEPMKEPMGTPAPAYNPAFAQPSPMPLQNVAQHQQRSYDVAGAGGGSREEVVHNGDSAAESKAEVEVQEVENEKLGPGDVPEKHLDLAFDVCFHEHKNTKTFPKLYQIMGVVYKYTKLFVYHIFVIVFGFLFMFLWAIINGITAFVHVWIYSPLLKLFIFWTYATAPLVTVPMIAIFRPLVDVSARIFRQIRVKATLDGSLADRLAGHVQNV